MLLRLYVNLVNSVRDFKNKQDGVTAIEYGLIAAFIAIALVVVLPSLQNNLVAVFNKLTSALNSGVNKK